MSVWNLKGRSLPPSGTNANITHQEPRRKCTTSTLWTAREKQKRTKILYHTWTWTGASRMQYNNSNPWNGWGGGVDVHNRSTVCRRNGSPRVPLVHCPHNKFNRIGRLVFFHLVGLDRKLLLFWNRFVFMCVLWKLVLVTIKIPVNIKHCLPILFSPPIFELHNLEL